MSGTTETMRAVRITRPGGADVLEIASVPRPVATGDYVLVRVRATALNRADVLQRMGRYPAPDSAPADIPGLEFAGEVVGRGADARGWREGARVFGITAGGAHAEYVVVKEDALAAVPENLDWTRAAAVPEAFITAHDAMFDQGGLTIGESVCIHAVGSGVGLAAAQLARASGARVLGTARTAEKLERARAYGLDAGASTRDGGSEFVDAARAWTNERGLNLILDLVGASLFAPNLESLAVRGRLLLVGSLGGSRAEMDWSVVMRKRLRITGTVLRSRSSEEKARAVRLFGERVAPLLASGAVRPVVDSVFDLNDVRRAHERMESNESFGKIVLLLG